MQASHGLGMLANLRGFVHLRVESDGLYLAGVSAFRVGNFRPARRRLVYI